MATCTLFFWSYVSVFDFATTVPTLPLPSFLNRIGLHSRTRRKDNCVVVVVIVVYGALALALAPSG